MFIHGFAVLTHLVFLQLVSISSASVIPDQLVMTGKPEKVDEMPLEVRGNILNIIALETRARAAKGKPPMQLRWLGDIACHAFIEEHFDEDLTALFDQASPGYYKGDICRTAVLVKEGGFYVDVDLELTEPLSNLVDDQTTFMSAYSINGDILNALLAVVPGSPVMEKALDEMKTWFKDRSAQTGLMGTLSTYRAFGNTIKENCPEVDPVGMRSTMQWKCGKHVFRLYEEKNLLCFLEAGAPQPSECPLERKNAPSKDLRLGLFEPGQRIFPGRRFIGWPRFRDCKDPAGCGSGGHGFLQRRVEAAEVKLKEAQEQLRPQSDENATQLEELSRRGAPGDRVFLMQRHLQAEDLWHH